jgi:hypothetical protein
LKIFHFVPSKNVFLIDNLIFNLFNFLGFQGFTNKGASIQQQNRLSDPPQSAEGGGSMLDQLKNELIKRAQFLSKSQF